MRRRKTFSASFGVSLFLHVIALFCFQKYSLWFSSVQTGQSPENWLSLVEKKERDQILKSTFDPFVKEESKKESVRPIFEEQIGLNLSSQSQISEFNVPAFFQFSLPISEPLLSSSALPSFSLPMQSFNLLEHLPKDLMIPELDKPKIERFLPLPVKADLALSASAPMFDDASLSLVACQEPLSCSLTEEPQIGKAPSPIPLASLPSLPSLEDLDTSSYSDSFDADLVFLPKEEGKGYIFALTLIPRPDLNLPKLKQNITFLIDRSNSVQQGRLSATKAAIHKALKELSSEDCFNLIAFDSKIDKMSPHFLPCVGKSFAKAEGFLETIQLGSFFSTSDLFRPLFLTVPNQVEPDEIHTAILLTDGETLAKRSVQRAVFSDWTAYNSGRVALFAVAMQDPHLAILDAAASMNRGKLIFAPSYRGMKRKLIKLLRTIQNPIAKNISCHAICRSTNAKMTLFPKTSQMPHLYLEQPYVILGETDALDDFILFVQGRLKGRWLNIRKSISFLNARKGNRSLKQEMALQQAYQLYEQFSIDENPKHLADAEALLKPFDFESAIR